MKKILIGVAVMMLLVAGSAFGGQDTGGDKGRKHRYRREHRHGRYRGHRHIMKKH